MSLFNPFDLVRANIYRYVKYFTMKYSRDRYIKANIQLSLCNTEVIMKSMDANIKNILEITQKMESIEDPKQLTMCLLKIKDISLESVIEKCNMLKAALDRFTIPYEDVVYPQKIKYLMMRSIPKELRPKKEMEFKRFKDKISKGNMPAILSAPPIDDDGGADEY